MRLTGPTPCQGAATVPCRTLPRCPTRTRKPSVASRPVTVYASSGVESAEELLQRASSINNSNGKATGLADSGLSSGHSNGKTTGLADTGVSNGHSNGKGNGQADNVASTSGVMSTSEAAKANGNGALEGTEPPATAFDGRKFRRSLGRTGRYIRTPVNNKDSLALMDDHGVGYSTTGLIAQMRKNGNMWQFKDVTIKLAEAYGYCWGVERAVQMAYEARSAYPNQRIHVTNEIIHNPAVNQRLKEMDIAIIETTEQGKDFSNVKSEDVVILPAFGASVQEMRLMNDREVQIVDTTCPWVSKVWNAVDNQTRKNHTSIIHGKYSHEETVATASFAQTYLVVRDLEQTRYLCNYIVNGGDREEFLQYFKHAHSEGFDPDRDLERVGLANQTTMLRNDTLEIGKMLERAVMTKFGPAELKQHYMVLDTICDATQERQDAVTKMVQGAKKGLEPLDMMLVVGGFNSSNTSHLQEIPEHAGLSAFWVNSAACVDANANSIQHKMADGELRDTKPWLPDGPLTIGVTSGASTPDRAVEDVLDRVFRIRDPSFTGIVPALDLLKERAEAVIADGH